MNPAIIRVLLILMAAYMIWKSATAPSRGAFLTLFGNIGSDQPRVFRLCLIAGYTFAAILVFAALSFDTWSPALADL